jgi:hypothetical protein
MNRGAGYTVLKRGRRRNYYIREHKYFEPLYRECTNKDLKTTKRFIQAYLQDFKALYAKMSIFATTFFYSNALGIQVPQGSFQDLLLLYAIPIYYIYIADEIKAKTFVLTELFNIPPKGQIYTAVNYLIEDSNFLTFFVYNLALAKRFLKIAENSKTGRMWRASNSYTRMATYSFTRLVGKFLKKLF